MGFLVGTMSSRFIPPQPGSPSPLSPVAVIGQGQPLPGRPEPFAQKPTIAIPLEEEIRQAYLAYKITPSSATVSALASEIRQGRSSIAALKATLDRVNALSPADRAAWLSTGRFPSSAPAPAAKPTTTPTATAPTLTKLVATVGASSGGNVISVAPIPEKSAPPAKPADPIPPQRAAVSGFAKPTGGPQLMRPQDVTTPAAPPKQPPPPVPSPAPIGAVAIGGATKPAKPAPVAPTRRTATPVFDLRPTKNTYPTPEHGPLIDRRPPTPAPADLGDTHTPPAEVKASGSGRLWLVVGTLAACAVLLSVGH